MGGEPMSGKMKWEAAAARKRAQDADKEARTVPEFHGGECPGRWRTVTRIHGRDVGRDASGRSTQVRVCDGCGVVEMWDYEREAWIVSKSDMSRRVKTWMNEIKRAGYDVNLENGLWKVRNPDTGGLLYSCSPNISDSHGFRNAQAHASQAGIDWTRKRKDRAAGGQSPPPPVGALISESPPDANGAGSEPERVPAPPSSRDEYLSLQAERDAYNASLRERMEKVMRVTGLGRDAAILHVWEVGREALGKGHFPGATAKNKQSAVLTMMLPIMAGKRPPSPMPDSMRAWWDLSIEETVGRAELASAPPPPEPAPEPEKEAAPMPTAPPAEAPPAPEFHPPHPLVSGVHVVATDPALALRTMKRMMAMTDLPSQQIDQVIETGCDLLGVDREAVA